MNIHYSDEIFQRNLQYYSLLYPSEGGKIEALKCEKVHFCSTATGEVNLTEQHEGKSSYFYSPEGIEEEIARWFEKQHTKNISVFYLFGLGLGYHYHALRPWIEANPQHHLVFLETNLEVVHRFLETDFATEVLHAPRVHVLVLDEKSFWSEPVDKFTTAHTFGQFTFSFLDYYQQEQPQLARLVSSQLQLALDYKQKSLSEPLLFGSHFFENYYRNLLKLPSSYLGSGLFGKFKGVPAIICGAGPSLEKAIPSLKKLKDKALIFAGGTALNALNAWDMQPHFGIGIDPNAAQKVRILSNTAYEVPFFYRGRFSHDALENIHGNRLWLPGNAGYRISSWFEKELDLQGEWVEEGNNVINMSLSLAHLMGCDPLICVGLDLAYTNGKSYSAGIVSHPIYEQKHDFITKSTDEELLLRRDIHGQEIFTLTKWLFESNWFAEFAARHPEISLVNATGGGIGFPGILNVFLEDFVDKLFPNHYDLEGRIHAEIQNNSLPSHVSVEKVRVALKEIQHSLERCQTLLKELLIEQGELTLQAARDEEVPPSFQTIKGREKLKELEKEVAYEYILKDLDVAFSLIAKSHADLELATLTEDAQEERIAIQIRTQINCYQNLSDAATKNLSILTKVLKENEENVVSTTSESSSLSSKSSSGMPTTISPENSDFQKEINLAQMISQAPQEMNGPSLFRDDKGSLLSQSEYHEGVKEGEVLLYYSSGEPYAVLNYKEGNLDGIQKYFFRDGLTKTSLNYSEGLLNGKIELYYPNGQIKREASFLMGKHHGKDKLWNTEGTLSVEAEYRHNKPFSIARAWYPTGVLKKLTIYDAKSSKYEVHQWDEQAHILPLETSSHDDYFDKVTKVSAAVADSLKTVIESVMSLVPLTIDPTEAQEDLMELAHKQKYLDKMQRELKYDSGLHEDNPLEPLWKSESSRRIIEKEIENVTNSISKQVSFLQNIVFEARTKFYEK